MALLLPDDPPKGRKDRGLLPVRERRAAAPQIPAVADMRARLAGTNLAAPRDATAVDPEAAAKEALRSQAQRDRVENRKEIANRSVPMSHRAGNMQEAIAQAVAYWSAQAAGAGKDEWDPEMYDKAMAAMDYMFAPITSEEQRNAIARWSVDPNAKYEDMPPGAGYSEMLAGALPGFGDMQAGRDIKRDFTNDQVSGWTVVDMVSLIPAVGAMFGMIRKGGKMADFADLLHDGIKAAEKAGVSRDAYIRAETLRRVGGLEGADLAEALRKEGMSAQEAEAAAKIGARAPEPEPIRSRVPEGPPRIESLPTIRAQDPEAFDAIFFPVKDLSFAKVMDADGNMYAFRRGPMQIHADAFHQLGLDLEDFLGAGGIRVSDFGTMETRGLPSQAQQEAMGRYLRNNPRSEGLTLDLIDRNRGGFLEEYKIDSAGDIAKLPEKIERRLNPPKAPAAGHAMGLKVEDLRFEEPSTARRFEAAVRTGPDAEPVTGLNHGMAASAAGVDPKDYAQVERGWVFTDANGNQHFLTPLEAKEAIQVVRVGQEPDLRAVREVAAEGAPAERTRIKARSGEYVIPMGETGDVERQVRDPKREAFARGEFAADVPEGRGPEPAHRKFMRMTDEELAEENALRQQHGVEPMTRERIAEIEAGYQRRQSPKPYGEVSLAPMDVERRVGGEGAEAFKKAYADDLEVTDADREIAMKHNEMIAERNLKDPDLGTTSALDGGELKGRYILSPGKAWETRIKTADGTITPQQVAAFRIAHGEALKGNGLGTWWDPKTGEVVFDVSKATDDVNEAGRVAVSARQDGIYDSETGKFIATEDIPREFPGGPLFERPDKRITNKTPLSQGETVNSFAAKLAGLTLMRGTSIDDALDWAETVFGPEIRLWEDELVPRITRIRERWVDKLPDIDERMTRAFEQGSKHFEEDWYSSILPTAKELFGEELGPIWARMYAYTSASAEATGPNITFANKGLNQYALGEPINTGVYPPTAGPMIARALEDMESPVPRGHESASSGIAAAKLKDFDENISFGGDRAVIDMWQSRLAHDVLARHGKTKAFDAVKPEEYQVIQGLTEGLARRAGVSNKGFQAGTWAGTKMEWDDPAPLITGGEALRRHPGSRLLPDEKTGILLPSFVGPKGRPVTYREKYGIPALLAGGYLGAGALRGSGGLLGDEETPALFRDPRQGLLSY